MSLKSPLGNAFKVVDYRTKRVLWEPPVVQVKKTQWNGDVLCLSVSDIGDTDEIPSAVNHLLLWDGKTRTPLSTPPIPPDATISGYSLRPDNSTITYSQYTKQIDPQSKNFIN